MTINISFKTNDDMDKFYNDFLNDMPEMVSSAKANIKHKNVAIDVDPLHDDSIDVEKNLINNIKQYMRDNGISYGITV